MPPRRVALDMTPCLTKAVALEFLPMGAQLLLKAALPLAGILATASGVRLNKKDSLTRYGNSHVKDKTS